MDADRIVAQVTRNADALFELTGDAPRWAYPLRMAMARFEINTPARQTHFVAQCGHESAGFRLLVENLHYSGAALLATWPHRFSATDRAAFAFDEKRIAERVYGGRIGNGPEGSGDGYRFRGRGLLQVTGRSNYRACALGIGVDVVAEPDRLTQPEHAAMSAAWYWDERGLNSFADVGDIEGITRAINGGTNGLTSRLAWLERAQTAVA